MRDTLDDGRHDFDFLLGEWSIHHRRLVDRFQGATEWQELRSTAHVVTLLDGLGVLDRYRFEMTSETGQFEAMTLRLFDPKSRLWTTWWTTSLIPGGLDSPVAGRAQDGCVRLFGKDVHAGRPVDVRFEYRPSAGGTHVRWEQAFSDDDRVSWEVNWTMDWTRI